MTDIDSERPTERQTMNIHLRTVALNTGWLVGALVFASPLCAQKINPTNQINWPASTGSGAPTASCTAANYGQPYTDITANIGYTCTSAGWVANANLPHVTQTISGNGAGGALGLAEKGTNVSGSNAWVAWNEDNGLDGAHGGGLGLFDCRDAKYGPGGCLGTHPQQAMQDLANDLVCFNHSTGLAANITFPPGVIPIGTAAECHL